MASNNIRAQILEKEIAIQRMELELLKLRVNSVDDAEDSSGEFYGFADHEDSKKSPTKSTAVSVIAQKQPAVVKKSLLTELNAKYDGKIDAHIQRGDRGTRRYQSVPNINTARSISKSRAESWVAQCRKSNWTVDHVDDFSNADTTSLSTTRRPNAVSAVSHINQKDKCIEYQDDASDESEIDMVYWTAKSKAKTVKRFHAELENDSRGRKFQNVRTEYRYDAPVSVGVMSKNTRRAREVAEFPNKQDVAAVRLPVGHECAVDGKAGGRSNKVEHHPSNFGYKRFEAAAAADVVTKKNVSIENNRLSMNCGNDKRYFVPFDYEGCLPSNRGTRGECRQRVRSNDRERGSDSFSIASMRSPKGNDEFELNRWPVYRQNQQNADRRMNNDLREELSEAHAKISYLEARDKQNSGQDSVMSKFLARQYAAKDLIQFSGNPEDWLLFYTQYKQTTDVCGFTSAENVARLLKCLKGDALESVRALLVSPDGADDVIRQLERRFGRPEYIIKRLIAKTNAMPSPKEDRPRTIIEFATAVENLTKTLENLKRPEYLRNPQLIENLESKLPSILNVLWSEHIYDKPSYTLRDFSDWLERRAHAASLRTVPMLPSGASEIKNRQQSNRTKPVLNANVSEPNCTVCSGDCKSIEKCEMFAKLTVDDKWTLVAREKMCFNCLVVGHAMRYCKSRTRCTIDDCGKKHHKFLHRTRPCTSSDSENGATKPSGNEREAEMSTCTHNLSCRSTMLRIVPVKLKGIGDTIHTYALLDPGSTSTFISNSLAEKLKMDGPVVPLSIQWANGDIADEYGSKAVNCKISGVFDGARFYELNKVRTVQQLPLPAQTIDKVELTKKWPYLSKIKFESFKDARPEILIGEDNALLTATRQLLHDKWNSPIASKTWLGWVISGNDGTYRSNAWSKVFHITTFSDDDLHKLVKSSFVIEDAGVNSNALRSREDERALKLMAGTTSRQGDGRWETGLLWRNDSVVLPDSYWIAEKRLKLLEKKFNKNPDLEKRYGEYLQDYVNKNYLRKLDQQSRDYVKVWYLPHFPVFNQMKPDKLRIVFDAAATANGMSLNDALVQGPDFLKPLPGVLFKFRQGAIGFIGDIKEMFHRIRIKEEDVSCQRILWRNVTGEIEVYELTVMMFGAKCSPSSAIYVKDRNALEYIEQFPAAVDAIQNKHYMDDYLDSACDVASASKMINDVIYIHSRGGFEIRNFVCSSPEVMEKIPFDHRRQEPGNIDMGVYGATDRVLGIWWNPRSDTFSFNANFAKLDRELLSGKKIPTKREVLRVVMSVYDPLGFVAHFVIFGKILLQQIWKTCVQWDDMLPDNLNEMWQQWLTDLRAINSVSVPRCYSVRLLTEEYKELHVFVDASVEAYCAVAYIKIGEGSETEVSFVFAKTRVAPLKPMTIPRLELQAALLGSKIANFIRTEHSVEFNATYYWTDSMTVLHWINSDARRFKQFVAFRLGEISELTNVRDWLWLPSECNVADDATRLSPCSFESSARWYTGPDFLRLPKSQWPAKTVTGQFSDEIAEETVEFVHMNMSVVKCEIPLPLVERFSNYLRIVRTTGWILRFIHNLRHSGQKITGELTVDEFNLAELHLIRRSQIESFPSEINSLTIGRSVPKTSKLFTLTTKLNEMGIIQMDGRMNVAKHLPKDVRNPIILDGKKQLTRLIIDYYHRKHNHLGHESVLNEIRQRFWIVGVKPALKRIRRECNGCKLLKLKPANAIMGQLPIERLTPNVPVFTYTGIDYFGPMIVKVRRTNVKRYGVLFTCLTVRAIHIEIANDLTTDACIMAIRRFIARRGCPVKIFSDNGTNLRGADTELTKSVAQLDADKIRASLTKHRVDWNFIPPASPHMGGCWERMVRSVKTALSVTLKTKTPSEEVLTTLCAEAEHMINSRPLVDVSNHPDEEEAITPNHLLIGRSSASAPIGEFDDDDLILRKQWRASQRLADLFWQRWVREYMPTLTRRTKWFVRHGRLKPGDLVFMVEKEQRGIWQRGRITAVYPGPDGEVRVADVATSTGTYRRPVVKLCLLDVGNGETNTAAEDVAHN